MKYFVISDIHGSSFFLKKALKHYDNSFDGIIILGDVLYHGPRNDIPEGYNPKEVIEILNKHCCEIVCVRGNCDAEVDQMVLKFKINEDYRFHYSKHNVYLTHGHHLDFSNLASYESDIILYGHYHIPTLEKKDNILLANPGSITIDKDRHGHTYMEFEQNALTIKDLDGNEVMKISID